MLTRIYGTAFHSQKDLDEHLERLELARENDHRRLGPELDLFRLRDEAPGMPFWLPNGTILLRLIEAEVREQLVKRGYQEIKTPRVLDVELWHRSGHWDNYRDNMYFVDPAERDGEQRHFAIKPMNCRGRASSSARPATPIASSRCGSRSSATSRASSARACFTACCGCGRSLRTTRTSTARSTRCPTRSTRSARRSMSSTPSSASRRCESSSRRARRSRSAPTRNGSARPPGCARRSSARGASTTSARGRALFYGPKIDFHVTDAIGRSWQLGTCQLDFQMPERFELSYQGEDNADHRPVMIHRALLGSMERFAGILIEHYGGRFPAWLAPVQIGVLPVSDQFLDYARQVAAELRRRRAAGHRRRAVGIRGAQNPGRGAREAAADGRRRRARAGRRHRIGALPRSWRPRGDGARRDPGSDRGLAGLRHRGGEPRRGPGVTGPGRVAPLTTSLSRGNGCTEVFRVRNLYHGLPTGTAVMIGRYCVARSRCPLGVYTAAQ